MDSLAFTVLVGVVATDARVVSRVVGQLGRLRRWWLQRRAARDAAIADLKALNSTQVIHGPGVGHLPPVKSAGQRQVTTHELLCNDETRYHKNVHAQFCATWARAAKGRFMYAHECQDTALNRAALFRWLRKEWTSLGMQPHHVELYMADTLDLSFEMTMERFVQQGKRAFRRAARAAVYNATTTWEIKK